MSWSCYWRWVPPRRGSALRRCSRQVGKWAGSRNLCSVSWFQLCLWAAPPGLSCGFLGEPANYPLSLKPAVLQLAARWNLMLGPSPGMELGQRSFLKVPTEKAMATHSSVLAWRIPGTAEPGGWLSMGSHRVRHDWSDLAVAAAAATL